MGRKPLTLGVANARRSMRVWGMSSSWRIRLVSGICAGGSRSWDGSALASERPFRLDVETALGSGSDAAWECDSQRSRTRDAFSSNPCPPPRWDLGPQLPGLVSEREPRVTRPGDSE